MQSHFLHYGQELGAIRIKQPIPKLWILNFYDFLNLSHWFWIHNSATWLFPGYFDNISKAGKSLKILKISASKLQPLQIKMHMLKKKNYIFLPTKT